MQAAGAASEIAVSEMQQLRDQMLAMQKQLSQTQEKLQDYERTSLAVSRDAKKQDVEDHETDEIFDDLEQDSHNVDVSDEMHIDNFTARAGKKSSCPQRMLLLTSGKRVSQAEFDLWKTQRNALLDIENEVGTAAMTPDEVDRRIMLTKQINGLPTGPPHQSEVEKTIAKYFTKETAEDEKDAKTEKNSKFLAASYNAESIVYNDVTMILYDVSMLPEVQAICKFQDWPALKKHFDGVALRQTCKDARNMFKSIQIDMHGQYAGLVQISVFYNNRLAKLHLSHWKVVGSYTFLSSVHGISQLRRGNYLKK
jgi:hypothetical protein